MEKITIEKMSINHFKGIKKLDIEFKQNTSIFGANATGKSTVFDAFIWVLFGKDSAGKTDFNIKPLDSQGKATSRVESDVAILILTDDNGLKFEHNFRKVYSEKWTKKRGSNETVFTGNEVQYFYNDVPYKMAEFQSRVSEIIKEDVFRLITNLSYFHSLNKKIRREILISIAGEVSDTDIAASDSKFSIVTDLINQRKSIEEYRRELAAKKRKIKDELEKIPTRIDEVQKNAPAELDWAGIKVERAELEERLADVQKQIDDKAQRDKAFNELKVAKQQAIFRKQNEIDEFRNQLKREINAQLHDQQIEVIKGKNALASHEQNARNAAESIKRAEQAIEQINADLVKKRAEFEEVNGQKFDFNADECVCPVCKRQYDENHLQNTKEEALEKFNQSKAVKVAAIRKAGIDLNERLSIHQQEKTAYEAELVKYNDLYELAKAELEKQEKVLQSLTESAEANTGSIESSEQLAALSAEYLTMQNEFDQLKPEDDSELLQTLSGQRSTISLKIRECDSLLHNETIIAQNAARIQELKEQESRYSQELANFEADENILAEFEKRRMTAVENNVNRLFKYVKFRMFDTQVDGQEVPTCDTLVDGVPFEDANTASKINAGIDIINVLGSFHNVSAPIFIDNRESVTEIIPTNAQVINLVVSPSDNQLRIA